MITPGERSKIVDKGLTCPICLMDFEDVDNKDIVGCMGASKMGWSCCSKQTGCKNSYFHKKCIETWIKRQEAQHIPPSCPICRAKKPKKKPQLSHRQKLLGITGLGLLGAGYQIGQGFMSVPNLERCYNPEIGSLGEGLPTCNGCNVVQSTSDGDLTWHYPRGPPGGVCPSYFDDSWLNWRARLENLPPSAVTSDAETWRKREGIQAKVSRRRHKFRLGARDETFKKLHKPFIHGNYTPNDVKKIYDYLVSGLAQKVYIERVKRYNSMVTQVHVKPPKTPRQLLINVLKTAKDSYRSRKWHTAPYDDRQAAAKARGVSVPHTPYDFPTRSAPYGGIDTDSIYAKDKSGVGLLVAAGMAKWGDGRGGVSDPNTGAYAYNFLPKYLLGAAPDGKGPTGRDGYPEKVLNSIRLQPVEINALLRYAERRWIKNS